MFHGWLAILNSDSIADTARLRAKIAESVTKDVMREIAESSHPGALDLILDVFNEYGIAIMTPSYMADPAEPKLVPKDQWYAPPATPGTG